MISLRSGYLTEAGALKGKPREYTFISTLDRGGQPTIHNKFGALESCRRKPRATGRKIPGLAR